MWMPHLVLTNQHIQPDFTPADGCLSGEASKRALALRWIEVDSVSWESVATLLTMSTVDVVGVLRKVPPDITEKNQAVDSNRLGVGKKNQHLDSVLVSASTGYGRTLVYQPLPVTAKEILLQLEVCQLAQKNLPATVHILEILALSAFSRHP